MTLQAIDVQQRDRFRSNQTPFHLGDMSRALAIVLHERTGWDLVAIAGQRGLAHFGVRDTEGRYRDVRGILTKDEFCQAASGVVVDTRLEQVRGEGEGWDRQIERARMAVGLLFADLPGVDPWQARLLDFAAGLEKLCNETGLWFRSESWAGMPVYESVDGDQRFEIGFDDMGSPRLHRVLSPVDR